MLIGQACESAAYSVHMFIAERYSATCEACCGACFIDLFLARCLTQRSAHILWLAANIGLRTHPLNNNCEWKAKQPVPVENDTLMFESVSLCLDEHTGATSHARA